VTNGSQAAAGRRLYRFNRGRRRPRRRRPAGERRFALLSVAPATAVLLALAVYPIVYLVRDSLMQYSLLSTLPPRYNGGHNYSGLVHDSLFWSSLRVTGIFLALVIVVELPLALLLALALNRLPRFQQVLVTLLLIPSILSPSVASFQFVQLFDYSSGVLNYFLKGLGVSPQGWTASPSGALPSLLLVDLWQWTPFLVLLLFAGLRSLPRPLLEAARIDGSKPWQLLVFQMLPMLRRVIAVALVLRLLNAFKVFDTIYVLTAGGPGTNTESLSYYIYVEAFRYFNIGYASAMALVSLVIVIVLVRIVLRVMSPPRARAADTAAGPTAVTVAVAPEAS